MAAEVPGPRERNNGPAVVVALIGAMAIVVGALIAKSDGKDSAGTDDGVVGDAVTVQIEPDLDWYGEGWSLAFEEGLPSDVEALGVPDHNLQIRDWGVVRGGVDITFSAWTVLITNRSDVLVRVTDLRPRVISREDPIDGAFLESPPAGADPSIVLHADLDTGDRPQFVELDEESGIAADQPFFGTNTVSVPPQDSVEFVLRIETRACYCTYVLDLTSSSGGASTTREIRTPSGDPFLVSAYADAYDSYWGEGSFHACPNQVLIPMNRDGTPVDRCP